jgi:predicted MPP superfamily phosphohydrolase
MKLFIFYLLSSLIITKTSTQGDPLPTKQSQKPLFSFGIIADVQYSDNAPTGTRFYRSSPDRLKEAINTFKEDSVDFIINLGDLIDNDIKSFDKVVKIIDSSGIPVNHVPGNHDYAVEAQSKTGIPVLKPENGYYSFTKEGFRLIFLNGNEISTYSTDATDKIKEAREYIDSMKAISEVNALEWNGGISDIQIEWLEDQLTEAALRNEKVLISCHFPIFPENVHNLLNYREVLSVISKYNIIAWLNGHNHAGNYGIINRIHFITFRGMVETESTNSYSIAEVYRDKLIIRGFGREESRILEF